MEKPVLIILSL
ncbi:hypothetical protein VCHC17A1_3915, partial [Vibrio cholerae HC-17A1]